MGASWKGASNQAKASIKYHHCKQSVVLKRIIAAKCLLPLKKDPRYLLRGRLAFNRLHSLPYTSVEGIKP